MGCGQWKGSATKGDMGGVSRKQHLTQLKDMLGWVAHMIYPKMIGILLTEFAGLQRAEFNQMYEEEESEEEDYDDY